MKSFILIFMFELKETLKKKSLIISTVVLSLIIFGLTSIPFFTGGDHSDETPPMDGNVVETITLDAAFVFENPQDYGVLSILIDIETTYDSEADLTKAIEQGDVAAGFVVQDLSTFKYITMDSSIFNSDPMVFEELLRSITIAELFEANGIDYEEVLEIMQTPIASETITLGRDSSLGMPIAFAIMLIMYMLILMYGNGVSTSVAREKDSRTMELLITSTDTKQLILGKVFAAGLAGIIQISVVLLAGFIGFTLFKSSYPEFLLMLIQGEMSLDVMGVYLLFSISGYLLYLFIFAALGSLVSKVEDVASVTTPITMLFVLAYFIATFAMQMPDSTLTTVSSYIPFVSIFTMPIRYMLTTVSAFEIFMGLAIMIATTYLLSFLSIQIYRYGSLNYGNKLKLTKVVKDLLRDRKRSK